MTKLKMCVLIPVVNTRHLPQTYSFLEENFPDVLQTECFNDLNLPFCQEVKATELGHLFEHILILNIYRLKTALGNNNVVVNGKTEWNWVKDPEGLFHILVDIGRKDFSILISALNKSIDLFERLLTSTLPSPNRKFAYAFAENNS